VLYRKCLRCVHKYVSGQGEMPHPKPMLCEALIISVEPKMLPPIGVSPGHVRMACRCILLAVAAP